MYMKTCSKCGIEKDYIDFPKNKLNKDGYNGYCFICKHESQKKYSIKNHDILIEKKRTYYKENRDHVLQLQNIWGKNNKDKRTLYEKKKWDKIKSNNEALINHRSRALKWQHDHYIPKERKQRIRNYEIPYTKIKHALKRQIGETPLPELVEVKFLIYKTKKLCKTLKN